MLIALFFDYALTGASEIVGVEAEIGSGTLALSRDMQLLSVSLRRRNDRLKCLAHSLRYSCGQLLTLLNRILDLLLLGLTRIGLVAPCTIDVWIARLDCHAMVQSILSHGDR